MNIHYEHIGSIAWCEEYRDSLDQIMEAAHAGDANAQLLVVNCAAHFYGLLIGDFDGDMHALIDAVKAMDQNAEFA